MARSTCRPPSEVKKAGPGAQYVQAFKDKDGNRFEGGKTYRLRVPANVPVSAFSSQTLYETETRSMIQNPRNDSALSSYDTLKNDAVPANQLSFVLREGQQLHSLGRCEDFAARHRFGV